MERTVTAVSEKAVTSARHIARVAARLFAARGYDATPVRAIVEAAGVTKPTLYYHFGSKEGLARALLTDPLTGLIETLNAVCVSGGDPVAVLRQTFEVHFAFCREEPDRARFYYALCLGPHGTSAMAAELLRLSARLDAQVLDVVRGLSAGSVIPSGCEADCAKTLRGMIVTSTMDFLFRGEAMGPDLAGRLVGILLWGFGVPGSAGRGLDDG